MIADRKSTQKYCAFTCACDIIHQPKGKEYFTICGVLPGTPIPVAMWSFDKAKLVTLKKKVWNLPRVGNKDDNSYWTQKFPTWLICLYNWLTYLCSDIFSFFRDSTSFISKSHMYMCDLSSRTKKHTWTASAPPHLSDRPPFRCPWPHKQG